MGARGGTKEAWQFKINAAGIRSRDKQGNGKEGGKVNAIFLNDSIFLSLILATWVQTTR